MTNEEAIKILNEMIEYGWLISDFDKCVAIDALDMAIRALKNEQTDGDLINKSALDQIKWERDIAISQLNVLGYELGEKPRAEKTAELRIVGNTTMHYECSLCGGAVDKWDNYCKHCGAKMKGEAEREKVEQTYDWCKGCKEYDTEKHCCHRYSSFIRESLQDSINAVLEDIKAELKKYANHEVIAISGGEESGLDIAIGVLDKHISGKE